MHLAGSIADDQGRTVVALRFHQGADSLLVVGAHADLSHIDVAIGHGDGCQILLLDLLAGCGELRHLADLRSLGGLAAGVGIYLGVEDHDVHIFARGQHMVHTAVTDVIGPAVAAEDPDGSLGQEVLVLQDLLGQLAAVGSSLLQLRHQSVGGLAGSGAVGQGIQIVLASFLQRAGSAFHHLLHLGSQSLPQLAGGNGNAQAEFGVVFKQGVGPGRSAAILVDGVRSRRCAAAPDGGTAGGVGNAHAVAEQLSDQAGISSLHAACAGAGELQQGLLELAALDSLRSKAGLLFGDMLNSIVEALLLIHLAGQRLHHQGLVGRRADVGAQAAAHAVQRVDLLHKGELFAALAQHLLALHGSGGVLHFLGVHGIGADGGMGAHKGALVALDAVFRDPFGHVHGYAALLIGGNAQGECAVGCVFKGGNRQLVALLLRDGVQHVLDEADHFGAAFVVLFNRGIHGVGPSGGHLDLVDGVYAGIDGLVVHLDDVFALAAIGFLSSFLHVLHRIVDGDDVGQLEESGLQDGVGALAHADLAGLVDGVHGVELDVVLGDVALHGSGQMGVQLFGGPLAVQQESAARLDILHDVVLIHIRGVVAGHEVSTADQIGGTDLLFAEAQMGDRQAASLLGVVIKVSLGIHIGVVADDLDGVFVGAHSAVAAQAPELAGDGAGRCGVGHVFRIFQRQVGHVVGDADGELALHILAVHVGEHGKDVAVGGIFAAQAIAAAQHVDVTAGLSQRGDDIQIQRLAQRAGFLGAVQHGDGLDALRDGVGKLLRHEGAVQADFHQAHFFTLGQLVVDDFFNGVAHGAHGHDDMFGIGGAVVVEELVVGADLLVDFVHVLLYDAGNGFIVGVAGLSGLEEDVRVLGAAAQNGVFGVQSSGAELLHRVHVHHFLQVFIVPLLHFLDLVRGAETIEEMQEGNAAFDGGPVGNGAQVHHFLRVGAGQHGKAGLAASHDVLMIAEDRQGVGSQGAGRTMDDARQQLTCDLVHVGDHQQQTLGGGVRCGERARRQRAVHSTGGAGFGLHLYNADFLPENVLLTIGRPLVGQVSHYGRGSDGVNRRDVGKGIRYVCRSGITVHGFCFSCHGIVSSFISI